MRANTHALWLHHGVDTRSGGYEAAAWTAGTSCSRQCIALQCDQQCSVKRRVCVSRKLGTGMEVPVTTCYERVRCRATPAVDPGQTGMQCAHAPSETTLLAAYMTASGATGRTAHPFPAAHSPCSDILCVHVGAGGHRQQPWQPQLSVGMRPMPHGIGSINQLAPRAVPRLQTHGHSPAIAAT